MSSANYNLLNYLINRITQPHMRKEVHHHLQPAEPEKVQMEEETEESFMLAQECRLACEEWTKRESAKAHSDNNNTSHNTNASVFITGSKQTFENNINNRLEYITQFHNINKMAIELAIEWEDIINSNNMLEEVLKCEKLTGNTSSEEETVAVNLRIKTEHFFDSLERQIKEVESPVNPLQPYSLLPHHPPPPFLPHYHHLREHYANEEMKEKEREEVVCGNNWTEAKENEEYVWHIISTAIKPVVNALINHYDVHKSFYVRNMQGDLTHNNINDSNKQENLLERVYYTYLLKKIIHTILFVYFSQQQVLCSTSNSFLHCEEFYRVNDIDSDSFNESDNNNSNNDDNNTNDGVHKHSSSDIENIKHIRCEAFEDNNVDVKHVTLNFPNLKTDLFCKYLQTKLANSEYVNFILAPLITRVALPCIKEGHYYFKAGQPTAPLHQPQFFFDFVKRALIKMRKELFELLDVEQIVSYQEHCLTILEISETVLQLILFSSLNNIVFYTYGWHVSSSPSTESSSSSSSLSPSEHFLSSPSQTVIYIFAYNAVMINAFNDFCIFVHHNNLNSRNVNACESRVNDTMHELNSTSSLNVSLFALHTLCKSIFIKKAMTFYFNNAAKTAEDAFTRGSETLWRRRQLMQNSTTAPYSLNHVNDVETRIITLYNKSIHFIRFIVTFTRQIEEGLLYVEPILSEQLWEEMLAQTFRFYLSQFIITTEEIEVDWKRWNSTLTGKTTNHDKRKNAEVIKNYANICKQNAEKYYHNQSCYFNILRYHTEQPTIFASELIHAIYLLEQITMMAVMLKSKLESIVKHYKHEHQNVYLAECEYINSFMQGEECKTERLVRASELFPSTLSSACVDDLQLVHDRCVRFVVEHYSEYIESSVSESLADSMEDAMHSINYVLSTLQVFTHQSGVRNMEFMQRFCESMIDEVNEDEWRVPQLIERSILLTLEES